MASKKMDKDTSDYAAIEVGLNDVDLESNHDGSQRSSVGADDPFYPREGKHLTWKNVNMTALKGNKAILQDVWGEVPAKQTTAIMGPSGAGKTSLLNILSGRTKSNGKVLIEGDVQLNGTKVKPTSIEYRKKIAFVAQDDSLQPTSTPREAIKFSAKLRLSRDVTDFELDLLTNRIINALGLNSCADTYVGGELLKGISGGERKRTSVGVELVVKPTEIFLDEPTSGLDSYSATQLMDLLHKVANAGTSVLFTIHQPSSEVFANFDHLILLNKGRVMYQGSVPNVPAFFESCSRPVPPNFNPADWIMDVAQRIPEADLIADGFFPKEALVVKDDGRDSIMNVQKGFKRQSFWTQTSMVFWREIQATKRDTTALIMRFSISIFLNLLFGVLFFGVGKTSNEDQTNVNSHFGAIMMVFLSAMFGSAQPAIFAIPAERPIFLREYSTDHYSAGAYFISKCFMEAVVTFTQIFVTSCITFFMIGFQSNFGLYIGIIYGLAMASTAVAVLLGCSVPDAKSAQELLPLVFVPQFLFAGFFVKIDLLPSWLRWVQWLCSLSYGVRLGLLAEFEQCANDGEMNCSIILESANSNANEKWIYWLILLALFVVFRVWALFVLKQKANSFY